MTTTLAPSIAAIRSDAVNEIPVLDLGPYLSGAPGALAALGAELRHALEEVGFYFIVNHGVAQPLIDATFAAAKQFHAQPEDAKLALRINRHNVGYLPFKGSTIRHSQLNENNRPDLNEAYFVKRDLPAGHPDVVADKPFRNTNRWQTSLPGFRDTVNGYCGAMERLGGVVTPA